MGVARTSPTWSRTSGRAPGRSSRRGSCRGGGRGGRRPARRASWPRPSRRSRAAGCGVSRRKPRGSGSCWARRRRARRWRSPPRSARSRAGRSCGGRATRGLPLDELRDADRTLGAALRRAPAGLRGRPRLGQARRLRRARSAARDGSREAVAASCAIPFYFKAVTIGEREYVDGGAWSVSNLDAAPAGRESAVLFLHPTAALTQPWAKAFRLATELELQQLRRRGAQVLHVAPDAQASHRHRRPLHGPRAHRQRRSPPATRRGAASLLDGDRRDRAVAAAPDGDRHLAPASWA